MRRWLSVVCLIGLLGTTSLAMGQSLVTRYVPGEDYRVVESAPQRDADEPVQVTEFFLYTCPHCYHFDPELAKWVKAHPNIRFERVPVLFGQGGAAYARLYYTEQALGVTDRLHEAIFTAIHEQGRPLATRPAQRKFMIAHGVDGKAFDKAYDSEAVEAMIRSVATRMKRFQVTAVPSLSVGEQYWVSGRLAGDNDRMLDVVDYLIEQTRDGGEPDGA